MNRSSVSSSIDNSNNMHANTTTQDLHVTINEQIVLTRDQYELLKIISNASNKSVSEYIQKALIETMKSQIEFGDFCDMLLDKLDSERE
jgi:predicted lactoylglutathione lyase